jgi:hypothetical protein
MATVIRKGLPLKLSANHTFSLFYRYWYYLNYYIATDCTNNDDNEDGIKDKSGVNFMLSKIL